MTPSQAAQLLSRGGGSTAGTRLAIWDPLVGTKCHFNHLKYMRQSHPAQPCPWGLTRTVLALSRTKKEETLLQELSALSQGS